MSQTMHHVEGGQCDHMKEAPSSQGWRGDRARERGREAPSPCAPGRGGRGWRPGNNSVVSKIPS